MIIGMTGRKFSGKSTVCKYLELILMEKEFTVKQINFKDHLVAVAYLLGWDGVKDARGVKLLQTLGTDCVRAYNPKYWVDQWLFRVNNSEAQVILVDDVRFDNEAEAIRFDFGGYIFQVITADTQSNDFEHVSESGISPIHITGTYILEKGMKNLHNLAYQIYERIFT